MTDLPSSVGIEAVELVAEGPHPRSVTVRVTGRWRRRRAELRGQAMLVVEGPVGRQRFLAMPEPPSLTGAAPGTWRMSFSVPAALAPVLPGRTFLQLGGVMVPLPIGEIAVQGAGAAPAAAPAAGPGSVEEPGVAPEPGEEPPAHPAPVPRVAPDLLEARRARSFELAAENARRRAAELTLDVERLERELDGARAESERLRVTIGERERRLRTAEQQVHAEGALRADLEQELSTRTRTARHDLTALHGRVAELERELTRMRRAVDEAGHLAAAAEAARAEAERRLAERRAPEPASSEASPVEPEAASSEPSPVEPEPPPPAAPPALAVRAEAMRRELELHHVTPAAPSPSGHHRPAERAGDRLALRLETVMADRRTADPGSGDEERTAVLEQALAAAQERIEAQRAELEAQKVQAEAQRVQAEAQRHEVEAQRRRTDRAYEAIEFVRGELRLIRATVPASAPAPAADPAPPVATVAPPVASPAPPTAGPVQAERLTEALTRLRERTPMPPPEEPSVGEQSQPQPQANLPARPVKPWLGGVFRALGKQDPSMAGHLLLGLLPAQRAADPHPVAYDLVLSDVLCAHITVDSTGAYVGLDPTARTLSELDFQLVGDLASIVRLLTAGSVRRRLGRLAPGRRLARVRGDRRRIAALDGLLRARLTLCDLVASGVELDPLLALTVAGLMIEPEWTAGERFTIAHRQPTDPSPDAYLHIRDARAPLASTEAPHGPVATVLESPAADLLGVLAGATDARLVGEERPVALLRQWLDRAQSD